MPKPWKDIWEGRISVTVTDEAGAWVTFRIRE